MHCASCGLALESGSELCPHHHSGPIGEWSVFNRAMCDGLHRGVWPRDYELDLTAFSLIEEPAVASASLAAA
jgi:hypothetical protein